MNSADKDLKDLQQPGLIVFPKDRMILKLPLRKTALKTSKKSNNKKRET
jgi:hypothetical protein